ncbi:MAG: DNA topoisomerase [Pseudomonadota bacterium]
MSKPVFVVESASKEASIRDQWDKELITLIVDSPPIKISPQPNGKDTTKAMFSFTPLPSSREFIDKLLSNVHNDIYFAFDANQRGEYWSWMISEFIHTKTEGNNKLKRLRLNELTRDNIQKNLESPADIQDNEALAFQVKTIFDHFFSKHLERLIGTKIGIQGLLIDITTITIIFFLNERENEINNFSPKNKWQIEAQLAAINGNVTAKLKAADGITKDGLIKNKEDVKTVLSMLERNTFSVKSISRAPWTFYPPKPFNTLDLIQEAYLILGMDPEKTSEVAKQLFYGATINGKHQGLISFYSTLENDLPENLIASLRQSIIKTKGESALGTAPDSILSDQLPIVPIFPDLTPQELGTTLPKELIDLYALIRNRALAGQMMPAKGEKIEVTFQGEDGCILVTEANAIKENGYMEMYQGMLERKLLAQSPLADLIEGLKLKAVKIIPQRTSGIDPEYYTMETIFSDMAEMGFDMNDDVIAILKDMLQKGYMEISEEGNLRPLENSMKVVNVLDRAFPKMSGLNLIAYMVQTMDEAISGRKGLIRAVEQFNQTLNMHGNVLVKSKAPEASKEVEECISEKLKVETEKPTEAPKRAEEAADAAAPDQPVETSIAKKDATEQVPPTAKTSEETVVSEEIMEPSPEKEGLPPEKEEPSEEPPEEKDADAQEPQICPKCGSELNLKVGRFGPFYGCSAFPKCRFTKNAKDAKVQIEAEERTCAECGKPMRVRRGRFGLFWACTGYPQCNHTEPYGEKDGLDMDCPVCNNGKVRIRRTKIGKKFFVCSDTECEFVAWSQPHAIPCPVCGHPFLVEKKNARGETSLKCPKSGCKHQQSPPKEVAQEIAKRESSKASTTKKRPKASTKKKGVSTQSKKKKTRRSSKK